MDEVVAAYGKTVTIAAYLPNGQRGIHDLATRGYRGCTTVDGVHTVGVHVMGKTAGTTDTRNHSGLIGRDPYLCHGLVERGQKGVVATSGTPAGLAFLEVF